MPDLPVSDILDVKLSQLLDAPGCPLCARRTQAGAGFLDSVLLEGVTDTKLRRDLRSARGFCPRHTHQLLSAERSQHGSTTSSAVLLAAIADVHATELTAAAAKRGTQRKRALGHSRRPPRCLCCGAEDSAVADGCGRLARLVAAPEWQAAAAAAAFCLDHLLMLLEAMADDTAAAAIAQRQLARIEDLRERLDRMAHNSSYDRRHLLTDDEKRSAGEAAALLGHDPKPAGDR